MTEMLKEAIMDQAQIGSLHELAEFLAGKHTLGTPLSSLAQHAAAATNAASCSIMLLSESDDAKPILNLWASTEELPPAAWQAQTKPGKSIAWQVLEGGNPIVVADIQKSPFRPEYQRGQRSGNSFMSAPVRVGAEVIGVLNLTSKLDTPAFTESDLAVAEITATLIGQLVQVERLQTLLRSRVAQVAMAHAGAQAVESMTDGHADLGRVAKLLARSFYKDLVAAGFEPAQIINAASEVITQVSADIGRHKKRMARQQPTDNPKDKDQAQIVQHTH